MAMCENWQVFVHDGGHNHEISCIVWYVALTLMHPVPRNMVEEVICLSAKRGYTVFYRNREDNNVLSDIAIAHPASIEMMRKRGHIYNMPLLEVVGMTRTGKNFTMATAFMRNEQATTYRWVLQQIKHLYFSNAMSTENQEDVYDDE
ncbi:hypothetical protein M9H77_31761 [Catharanthus roseus]|uniref:Uncharacterized protein n=1 Tax=Catharanthus roseus TaxID=4058 RepID=A0ACC0A1W4_CATRO|nr:hypothetical protein M9H77_31761 [Catharanthus roseus]